MKNNKGKTKHLIYNVSSDSDGSSRWFIIEYSKLKKQLNYLHKQKKKVNDDVGVSVKVYGRLFKTLPDKWILPSYKIREHVLTTPKEIDELDWIDDIYPYLRNDCYNDYLDIHTKYDTYYCGL